MAWSTRARCVASTSKSATSACVPTATTSTCGSRAGLAHYLEDPYTPLMAACAAHRSRDLRVHRRRLRRARDRCAPGRGRHPGCPHRREGRRFRRHLVLEPLPRRAVRHGIDGVHAAARGNAAHAFGEVRARAGDPRALPAHRPPVRALRPRALPHGSARHRLGRGALGVADPHRSRRRLHRAVRRHGHGPAARSEAAGHSRHRVVQRPFLPHQPLGLWLHGRRSVRRAAGQAGRQARRHHRHRRHRGAVRAAPRPRVRLAVRVPAHAVVGGRARQRADRSRVVRDHRDAGMAAALARELHRQPGGRHGDGGSGAGRLDRPVASHPRARS